MFGGILVLCCVCVLNIYDVMTRNMEGIYFWWFIKYMKVYCLVGSLYASKSEESWTICHLSLSLILFLHERSILSC